MLDGGGGRGRGGGGLIHAVVVLGSNNIAHVILSSEWLTLNSVIEKETARH